jgi:hypothetical protein
MLSVASIDEQQLGLFKLVINRQALLPGELLFCIVTTQAALLPNQRPSQFPCRMSSYFVLFFAIALVL